MIVTGFISIGLVGCKKEYDIEIPDEDLIGLSELEKELYIDNTVKEELFQYLDWGWSKNESDASDG